MTDKDRKIIDEIVQECINRIRLKQIKDKQIEYVKTVPTAEEMQQRYPSIFKMLTREQCYIPKEAKKNLAKVNAIFADQPKTKPADYALTYDKFTKLFGIDVGKEVIIDGDVLAEEYYTNIMDATLEQFMQKVGEIQASGGEFAIDGDMIWKLTLAQKQRNINKGNDAGI